MMSRKTAVILFLAACAAIAAPPTLAAPERRRAETVSRRTHGTRRILRDKDGDGIDDYNARITSTTFCRPDYNGAASFSVAHGKGCKDESYVIYREVALKTCEEQCGCRMDCVAYTYNSKRRDCYLKSSCGELKNNKDNVSGFKSKSSYPSYVLGNNVGSVSPNGGAYGGSGSYPWLRNSPAGVQLPSGSLQQPSRLGDMLVSSNVPQACTQSGAPFGLENCACDGAIIGQTIGEQACRVALDQCASSNIISFSAPSPDDLLAQVQKVCDTVSMNSCSAEAKRFSETESPCSELLRFGTRSCTSDEVKNIVSDFVAKGCSPICQDCIRL